jgi:hypothetical protein
LFTAFFFDLRLASFWPGSPSFQAACLFPLPFQFVQPKKKHKVEAEKQGEGEGRVEKQRYDDAQARRQQQRGDTQKDLLFSRIRKQTRRTKQRKKMLSSKKKHEQKKRDKKNQTLLRIVSHSALFCWFGDASAAWAIVIVMRDRYKKKTLRLAASTREAEKSVKGG